MENQVKRQRYINITNFPHAWVSQAWGKGRGESYTLFQTLPEKKNRLENILQTNKPLFHAYYLREDLDQIWMQSSKQQAEKQLIYWCERAKETKLTPFIKVANTIMAKRSGILAWYDAPVTNAMLEGINNKIKVMKRRAYGYRDRLYFKLLLMGLKDNTNAIRG